MIGGAAYILYIFHVFIQTAATPHQIKTTRLTDAEKIHADFTVAMWS